MIKLYDFQKECLDAIVSNESSSKLVVLPTGSGKTVIFLTYALQKNKKTLILAHTKDLVSQTYERLNLFGRKKDACIFNKMSKLSNHNIVISTIQSASISSNLKKLKKQKFDLLIIDEAHHSLSDSYQRVIDELGFLKSEKELLGFTATPIRGDNKQLSMVFSEEVYRKELIDLMQKGILTDLKCYRIKTKIDLDSINIRCGDFAIGELSAVINTEERNLLTVQSYEKLIFGKKTIIFCVDINHAEEMAKAFRESGIECLSVHGKQSILERNKILSDFREGKINVLTNCQLLTEGFDEPSIEALIMARPTKSLALYMQMVGRGVRNFPKKNHCTVVELTDNNHDICSLPSLISNLNFSIENLKDGFSLLDKASDIKKAADEYRVSLTSDLTLRIEKYELVKKQNLFHKSCPPTPSQYALMNEYGIKYAEPISYEIASLLISNFLKKQELKLTYG